MRIALLLTVLAAPAAAACSGGDMVFSCQTGQKAVELCHRDGALIYTFGPEGRPELTIAEPLETVTYLPWSGFGRSIHQSVWFHNDGFTYEVWSSFDRIAEVRGLKGGVIVEDGGTPLAQLACDWGSITRDLENIADLKSGIGQCWHWDSQSWRDTCN